MFQFYEPTFESWKESVSVFEKTQREKGERISGINTFPYSSERIAIIVYL